MGEAYANLRLLSLLARVVAMLLVTTEVHMTLANVLEIVGILLKTTGITFQDCFF